MNYAVFCQAPADVQYALSFYDQRSYGDTFKFFVINVRNIYKFLLTLKLEGACIEYIPYPEKVNLRNPIGVIGIKKYIQRANRLHFSKIKNHEVYYFSNHFDWLTFSFINDLTKENSVFVFDHYYNNDNIHIGAHTPSFGLKDSVRLLIYRYLTGSSMQFHCMFGKKVLYFDYKSHGITEKKISIPADVFLKYAGEIDVDARKKNILFFESNDRNLHDNVENYDGTLTALITQLNKNGGHVYIKPHPRLGHSKVLERMNVRVLPDFIPGEFIPHHLFSAIIGIDTLAIAKISQGWSGPIYSVLEMFEFRDPNKLAEHKNFLEKQSNGSICFIHNVSQLP